MVTSNKSFLYMTIQYLFMYMVDSLAPKEDIHIPLSIGDIGICQFQFDAGTFNHRPVQHRDQ